MADLNSLEIATLAAKVVEHVGTVDADIGVKIAALRIAADTLQSAITMQAIAASLRNTLTPR